MLFIAAFIAVGAGETDEILESPVFQLIIFLFSSHTLRETKKIIEIEFILFQTPHNCFRILIDTPKIRPHTVCNGYEDLQRDADLNMENELVEFFTRERYLIQIEPYIEGDAFSFLGLLFLTQSDFDKE